MIWPAWRTPPTPEMLRVLLVPGDTCTRGEDTVFTRLELLVPGLEATWRPSCCSWAADMEFATWTTLP